MIGINTFVDRKVVDKHFAPGTTRNPPCVYLIGTRDPDAPVKIGYCGGMWDVEKRLAKLQTGNPEPLVIHRTMVVTNQGTEADLHFLLGHARIRGEWFDPTRDKRLRDLIAGRIDLADLLEDV